MGGGRRGENLLFNPLFRHGGKREGDREGGFRSFTSPLPDGGNEKGGKKEGFSFSFLEYVTYLNTLVLTA